MFKAGVAGCRVNEPGKTKLVDSTKTLHDGGIEDDKFPRFDPDCEPNGIINDLEATWLLSIPKGTDIRLDIA
jgi:hypothetical protein